MKLKIEPGKYIVAVSGGVDSVVLLDLLAHMSEFDLVVAHFDHGIRPDSEKDRLFVQKLAEKYDLPYIYEAGKLGPNASEETARHARYMFLRRVQKEQGARAIITAHHQDDLLETMLLNLLRGTGRLGLSSLKSTNDIRRPLLDYPKQMLQEYAKERHLEWREDSTNADPRYLRNHVRKTFMPRMSAVQREKLLEINHTMQTLNMLTNNEIDNLLEKQLKTNDELPRCWFISLPHVVACEVMASYLRHHKPRNIDRRLVDRLVIAAKTAQPHTMHDVDGQWIIAISKKTFQLQPRTPRKNG